jgi:hypothetical protein
MDKKAQFFPIYLVFLTVIICGLVVAIYIYQNNLLKEDVVSPIALLSLQDKQYIFEAVEKEVILQQANLTLTSLGESKWNSQEFLSEFKKNYFNALIATSYNGNKIREFLFQDVYLNGNRVPDIAFSSEESQRKFFEDIYIFSFENSNLKIERKNVEKYFTISVEKTTTKRNFPIDVLYSYSKQRLFSLDEIKKGINGGV